MPLTLVLEHDEADDTVWSCWVSSCSSSSCFSSPIERMGNLQMSLDASHKNRGGGNPLVRMSTSWSWKATNLTRKFVSKNSLPKKMIIYLYVLCLRMENRIWSKSKSKHIVERENSRPITSWYIKLPSPQNTVNYKASRIATRFCYHYSETNKNLPSGM